jgi:hypothetical protein
MLADGGALAGSPPPPGDVVWADCAKAGTTAARDKTATAVGIVMRIGVFLS